MLCRLRRCVSEKATAVDVASLELFARSDDGVALDCLAESRRLRRLFQSAVEAGDATAAFDTFVATWATFAKLSPTHPLFLRPLFQDAQIMGLLRSEVTLIMWLEMLKLGKGPGVAGTGHRALGGSLGVGKTYMMRGLALVTSALCSVATPITWNYEAEGVSSPGLDIGSEEEASSRRGLVPISVLLNCHEQYEHCVSEAECSAAVRAASGSLRDEDVPTSDDAIQGMDMAAAGLYPLLLLDEVSLWYRTDGLEGRGNRLVTQLLHFGRHPNRVAVVAGSSSCLREQLFGCGSWAGLYPSLNPAVFAFAEIAPLRDVSRLAAYLDATGIKLSPDLSVDALLSLSGGVGRIVAAVAGGERKVCGRVDPLDLFQKEQAFAILVAHVLGTEANTAVLDAAVPPELPPPVGLPEPAVRAFLRDAGFEKEASRMLERWRDGGVFLLSQPLAAGEDPRVEFLFPHHAHLLRQRIGDGCLRDILYTSMQLHGVVGRLGHGVERLCRRRLHRLFVGCSQRMLALVMERQVPYVVAAATAAERAPLDPRACLKTVIAWNAQVGIEDFVLHADDDYPSVIHVDAWQCKSPAVNTVATWNDDAAVTAAIIRTKTLAPATNPIMYLDHAVAKARWGFCALVGILHLAASLATPTLPPPRFQPRVLHFCTSAVLDASASAAARTPFRFPEPFVAAYNKSVKAVALGAPCPPEIINDSFNVVVHDGLDWLDTLLPEEHMEAFASPVLRERADACRRRVQAAGGAGSGAGAGAGAPLGRR